MPVLEGVLSGFGFSGSWGWKFELGGSMVGVLVLLASMARWIGGFAVSGPSASQSDGFAFLFAKAEAFAWETGLLLV